MPFRTEVTHFYFRALSLSRHFFNLNSLSVGCVSDILMFVCVCVFFEAVIIAYEFPNDYDCVTAAIHAKYSLTR